MRIPTDDPISYLVRRKFPDASAIRSMPSIIGQSPQIPHEYRKQRRAEIDAYEAGLRELAHAELMKLRDEERVREAEEWATKRRKEEEVLFFNRPDSKADFEYWARAAYWSIEEALALSFGRDPTRVNWETVKSLVAVSPFAANYSRQRTLLLRAVAVKQLTDGTLPGVFLAWAKRNRFPYPPELEAAVAAHGHQVADWKTLYDGLQTKNIELQAIRAAELDDAARVAQGWQDQHAEQVKRYDNLLTEHNAQVTNLVDAANEVIAQRNAATAERDALRAERDLLAAERESLSALLEQVRADLEAKTVAEKPLHPSVRRSLDKMILGMAKEKFYFKPGAQKNAATKNIADALLRQGIKLDVDTVRARLQEAAQDDEEIATEKSA
jgi:hypothetical protein